MRLSPSQGGPEVQVSATFRRIVSVTAAGAPPGGVVTGEIVSPAGDPIALLAGLPSDPVPTPFGLLFVDLGAFVASGVATQGAGEHFRFGVPIPALARLRGAALALHAIHYDLARAELVLSNPTVVVLD